MQRCCNCCGNSSSSRSKKDRIGRKQKSNGLLAALGSAVLVIGTIAILGGAHSAAAGLVPQSFALSGRTEGQARAYSNRGGSSFGGGEDGKRCLIAVPTVRGGATGEGSEDQDEEVSFKCWMYDYQEYFGLQTKSIVRILSVRHLSMH